MHRHWIRHKMSRQLTTIYDIFCPVPFLPSPMAFGFCRLRFECRTVWAVPVFGSVRLFCQDFAKKGVAGTVSLPIFPCFSVFFRFLPFLPFSFFPLFCCFSLGGGGSDFFRLVFFFSFSEQNGETPFARLFLRNPDSEERIFSQRLQSPG